MFSNCHLHKVLDLGLGRIYSGPYLEQVQQVQLHPSIFDNGCMHPSIFRLNTYDFDFKAESLSEGICQKKWKVLKYFLFLLILIPLSYTAF